MSSDRRWVPIPVDDPRVTHLEVVPWLGEPEPHSRPTHMDTVPVPPDDRLGEAGREAARIFAGLAHGGVVLPSAADLNDMADTLRAAFQLGEEE